MNLLSGNFTMQLDLTLESLLSRAIAAAESDENDQSSSPCSSTEEEESGITRLPLRKTSTKVALNGQMIQVMEAQVCCNHGDGPINATVIKMETL